MEHMPWIDIILDMIERMESLKRVERKMTKQIVFVAGHTFSSKASGRKIKREN